MQCIHDGQKDGVKEPGPVLDGRTYHVFKYREKAILYDVGTDLISQIDDPFIFDLLEVARHYDLAGVVSFLEQRYQDVTREKVLETLQPFIENGLFQYEEQTRDVIEEIKRTLLNHHPRRIQLYIAQACNLACVYCYAEDNGSNQRNELMTFQTAKEAIDHLVERSGGRKSLSIQFFGGEPLLNVNVLKEVVEYTKELRRTTGKRFHYQISTNGTLLTEELQDYIVQHDMGTLVSIDGDEETHNRQRPLRGGGNSYHLVIDKAKSLNEKFKRRGKKTLKIRANIINDDNIDPQKISDSFEALGFTHVGISGIFAHPGEETRYTFDRKAHEIWREKSDKMFMEWLEGINKGEKPPNNYIRTQVTKALKALDGRVPLGTVRCGIGRNCNSVDVDGNIYPCHRYVGMENYILGNVRTGLDRGKLMDYYDQVINNSLTYCAECWARTKCGGLCPWEISKTNGEIAPPPQESCRNTKHGFERSLYMYVCLAERHPNRLRKILGQKETVILKEQKEPARTAGQENS